MAQDKILPDTKTVAIDFDGMMKNNAHLDEGWIHNINPY